MRNGWTLVRIHGLLPCLAVAVLHSALIAALGAAQVKVGWLGNSSSLSVPLATLLPALSIFGFAGMVVEPYVGERWALRPLATYRMVMILAAAGLAVAAPWVAALASGHAELGVLAARNVLGLLGLALVLHPVIGDASWLCPTILCAFEIVFGVDGDGFIASWAWTLHAMSAPAPWGIAATLAAGGFAATALSLTRERRVDEGDRA